MDQRDVIIQSLENAVQQQARIIELMQARGPFAFFQKRRLRKRALDIIKYKREDELRNSNLRLKAELRKCKAEHGRTQ